MATDASKNSDRYEPIDCNVHDQLLERATLGQPTEVRYEADDTAGQSVREERVAHGIIEDVFTREGAEYLRIAGASSAPIEIRLDKIVHFGDDE